MISPLETRYRKLVEELDAVFSDRNYVLQRIEYEKRWLAFLVMKGIAKTPDPAAKAREIIALKVEPETAIKIDLEGYGGMPAINHDVKAIEYAIRLQMQDLQEWVHFGLTSEDINNIALAQMLQQGTKVLLAKLEQISATLDTIADEHAATAMIARTHGQYASPTTFGKEIRTYHKRLERELLKLAGQEYLVKFSGTTGNFNSMDFAAAADWIRLTEEFVNEQGFIFNRWATQREPGDWQAELFQGISRVNTILLDLALNLWNYASLEYLKLKKPGEIGSSTMPHKVNPIEFENAEGNLQVANSLFELFARKIPISRYQRDLSDSTVRRNYGVAFAHSLVAYKSLMRGMSVMDFNREKASMELAMHPEVITEAIQTRLRVLGFKDAYERLLKLSQGRSITISEIRTFIAGLDIPAQEKQKLSELTPEKYIGLAAELARTK